jgi:hypothetical protein
LSQALKLARDISPKLAKEWAGGSPADWANESYDISRQMIYMPAPVNGQTLDVDYDMRMLPVIDRQLERAGIRLAKLLNDALR